VAPRHCGGVAGDGEEEAAGEKERRGRWLCKICNHSLLMESAGTQLEIRWSLSDRRDVPRWTATTEACDDGQRRCVHY
jgi:hypothetical protein